MRRAGLIAAFALAVLLVRLSAAPGVLTLYFIDVEGGQSTLIVSPSGGQGDRIRGRVVHADEPADATGTVLSGGIALKAVPRGRAQNCTIIRCP